MLKAILRNGVIVPLEPVPPEWEDGAPLEIDRADDTAFDIDAWAKSLNELCADSTPEDEDLMRQGVADHRQQSKAQVRREMGLSA